MADFVSSLVDMGFDRSKAEKAVRVTGNIGVEPALDWITRHLDDDDDITDDNKSSAEQMEVDAQEQTKSDETKTDDTKTDDVARSYKCEDCGKILKDANELEYHAAKTKHVNFSESNEEKKPLTDEEKAEQLKRIEQKMKEKRVEREAKEKQDELEREKSRIKSGKDLLEAKKLREQREIQELVDARRREKLEEKAARERVRAQIEADKAARKAKQAEQQGVASTAAVPSPVQSDISVQSSSSSEKKDYKEAKLQLRLPSGKALVHSFGAQEPLAAVRLYVELNRDDGATGPFNLMSTFPRKVYEGDDYNQPLHVLGLVPSAVLIVTRLPST